MIVHANRGAYGSSKVYKALIKMGYNISKKRVERLMQQQGLKGRVVLVTCRQPKLKQFMRSGENLRLNQPEPTGLNQV